MRIRAKVEATNGLIAYVYKDVIIEDDDIVKIGRRYDEIKNKYHKYYHDVMPYTPEGQIMSFDEWFKKNKDNI